MNRKSSCEILRCRYFRWVLRKRRGVFWADGRTNRPSAGRHSLGTRSHDEALRQLENLDRVRAVEVGFAERSILGAPSKVPLGLQQGWDLYRQKLERPEVAGGASTKTRQRYGAIVEKFFAFASNNGITSWNELNARVVGKYLSYLQKKEYAARTLYMEGTFLKQVVKWLVEENFIPSECRIKLPLRKVQGSPTYCWKPKEVSAIIDFCDADSQLRWLGDLLVTLAHTGLRIGEAAGLRWQDIDLKTNLITLANEPAGAAGGRCEPRRTKNRRNRQVPVHPRVRAVLEQMPRPADGRVFHGPRGGRLKPDKVRNALVRDVIAPLKARFPSLAGETGFAEGRLHSFRHFFCSTAANAGVPLALLMEWLGHRDSRMVRHYYHLLDAESQRQMIKIDFTGGAGHDVVVAQPLKNSEAPQSEGMTIEETG